MRELSLFTGAGGGLLASHLLGWTTIGYVEIDDFCQQNVRRRIDDGILPRAPIFTDVRLFVESGYAREYRGFADVVSAGFPCQPFSAAGAQLGADDDRNMWPATLASIRAVQPRYAFLENVPGLLSAGDNEWSMRYYGRILGDLAESGYDVRWCCLSAAELGAFHRRDRLWLAASHRANRRLQEPSRSGGIPERQTLVSTEWWQLRNGTVRHPWWSTESEMDRVVDEYAGRVDFFRAAGNAQVASVAAAAWLMLTAELF